MAADTESRFPFITLALRQPRMDTAWVKPVQAVLRRWPNLWPGGKAPDADGIFGPGTAQASQTWLWRFGAPASQVRPALGPIHQLYLLGYRSFPSDWKARRLARVGKPVPAELRYLAPEEPVITEPMMIRRADWARIKAPTFRYTPHKGRDAVLHWNGLAAGATGGVNQEMEQANQWLGYHVNHHRWSWGGYGWSIGMSGTIFEWRGINSHGSHSGALANARPGILLQFGKRDDNGRGFTGAQLRSAQWLSDFYELGGWRGHREYSSTECPGEPLMAVIRANRSRLSEGLWS